MNPEYESLTIKAFVNNVKQNYDESKKIRVKENIIFQFANKSGEIINKPFTPSNDLYPTLSGLLVSLNFHMSLEYKTYGKILIETVEITHDETTTYVIAKSNQQTPEIINMKLNNINMTFYN